MIDDRGETWVNRKCFGSATLVLADITKKNSNLGILPQLCNVCNYLCLLTNNNCTEGKDEKVEQVHPKYFLQLVRTALKQNYSCKKQSMHCPKNNLNLGVKTEPVTPGAEATVYVRFLLLVQYIFLAQKPDIYRCICSNRDMLCF